MIPLEFPAYLFLAAAGLLAGWVDSIAGGGGIITLPALLAVGLPPHLALGTNKLQSTFGSMTAAFSYRKGGLIRFRQLWWGVLCTAVGAATGTWLVQQMDPGFLSILIPVMLTAILVYMLQAPKLGDVDQQARMGSGAFHLAAGLGIGFYDGFFGPGAGAFWTIALVALLGLNLKRATAHSKVMNATSNFMALTAFALGGKVLILPGLVMGFSQLTGALIGSRMMIARPPAWIRVLLVLVVSLTLLKSIYSLIETGWL